MKRLVLILMTVMLSGSVNVFGDVLGSDDYKIPMEEFMEGYEFYNSLIVELKQQYSNPESDYDLSYFPELDNLLSVDFSNRNDYIYFPDEYFRAKLLLKFDTLSQEEIITIAKKIYARDEVYSVSYRYTGNSKGNLDFSRSDDIYGDVDFDKAITSKDAAVVLQYVLNSDSVNLNYMQQEAANVLNKGQVTSADASSILAKALNNDYQFINEKQVDLTNEKYNYIYKTSKDFQDIRTMENYGKFEKYIDNELELPYIVVKSGEVFDGKGMTYDFYAEGAAYDRTIYPFLLEDGATLRNVIIKGSATKGVIVEGNATLENVHTIGCTTALKINGNNSVVNVKGCSFTDMYEYTIRVLGPCSVNIKDSYFYNSSIVRQVGVTDFVMNVNAENVSANTFDYFFVADNSLSTITYNNLDLKNYKGIYNLVDRS